MVIFRAEGVAHRRASPPTSWEGPFSSRRAYGQLQRVGQYVIGMKNQGG